ncbi:general secretion pathway protein GspK [Marinomonas sp. C2222]|uniref:Type II secretion system protein K n=1 Tax=Marinomonas sargassi TaxID=2984494 RepID=A0ABT2YP25_9GAMM|nr:general secretion pathway protein GspK [Marinomonas sargassi]MCV2401459.1 general secretion pathway protein GspK [Marinomonas sargassi]
MKLNIKQKGSTLLLSLIALAIVTTFVSKTHLHVNHTSKLLDSQINTETRTEYLLAGEAWIENQLLLNEWPGRNGRILSSVSFDIEGGNLDILVTDFNSCINVNKFTDGEQVLETHNALMRLSDNVNGSGFSSWVGVIKDWIDLDGQTSLSGAEDAFYIAKSTSYRTPNGSVQGDSEWPLLNLNTTEFNKVLPFICAVDSTKSTINLNTAPKEVLLATLEDLSEEQAKLIVGRQQDKPFSNLSEFHGDQSFENIKLEEALWSTRTNDVFGLVKLTTKDQIYWLQTLVSKDENDIIKSSSRAFLPPNTYMKQRFNLKDNSYE